MKLDILVFAAHPDDAELGCSGTILKYVASGKKVGIVDLTRGELGTRGDAQTRAEESAHAAQIMGLHVRENLNMRDGFFKNDETHQLRIIQAIRTYAPEIILANAYHDRHPDHGRACDLVTDAVFLSGLIKIETEMNGQIQNAWRPKLLFHYIQDRYIKPDIVVDITPFWDQKMACINAFKTQFYNPSVSGKDTYISSPNFIQSLEARAREFGKLAGSTYAEGFTSRKILAVDDLFHLH
ncbi:MAG: bacillithiol biosynthesis deacetylase BshB1 [Sphingobacteriaceae bacterium]|nr:MAG: bacillithiol biosynthesis deacetylase BshB1 [Pedobacter sp.]